MTVEFTATDRTQVEAVRDATQALADIVAAIPAADDTDSRSDTPTALFRLVESLRHSASLAESVLMVADLEVAL